MSNYHKAKSILSKMYEAKKRSGKSFIGQGLDMLILRIKENKISTSEYYLYRLYSKNQYEKLTYMGYKAEKMLDSVFNDEKWFSIANDKIVFYLLMRGLDLPSPRIHAAYSPYPIYLPNIPTFSDFEKFNNYIKKGGTGFPFFIKPIQASYGKEGKVILKFDNYENKFILGDGKKQTPEGLHEKYKFLPFRGAIVQDLLRPCPSHIQKFGNNVNSVRVVTIKNFHEYEIHRATLKIKIEKNMTDNFCKGETGNLVAAINPRDGRIVRVVGGSGESIFEVTHHPETGRALVGEKLPGWEEICELCARASEALPGLAFQHWDVALTEEGPQLLEVNVRGGFVLHQVAHQTGMFDSQLAAATKRAKSHREAMETARMQLSGRAKRMFRKFRLR